MLLFGLSYAKLSELEHLEPALIPKIHAAKLDHLTIDMVVRRDLLNQHLVFWLNIGDHEKVGINTLRQLLQRQPTVV